MHFPFTEVLGLAEDKVFRPYVPIILKVNSKTFEGYALIDSGADYNILPLEIAKSLDLYPFDQPSFQIGAAGGKTFTVYKSPVEIDHIIKSKGRKLRWKSFVYFSEYERNILLGESGFVNKFKITLDGKSREIEIGE